jgi:hypothetical protein
MKNEIFREPLESLGRLYVYTWNENSLFRMQWVYSIEWTKGGKIPKIWITSYACWQRQTIDDAQFEQVDNVPLDIPTSEGLLYRLAEHTG